MSGRADPILYEGFSGSGYDLGANIDTLSGGTPPAAFEAAWRDTKAIANQIDTIQPGLTFTHSSGAALAVQGNSVLLSGLSGSTVTSEDERDITDLTLADGGVLWISFLLLRETGTNTNSDFSLLRLRLTSLAPEIQIGEQSGDSRLGLARASGPAISAYSSVVMETQRTYFLAARITLAATGAPANTDFIDLFIDPAPGSTAPVTSSATLSNLNIPGIQALRVGAGNHQAGASYLFDEIRLGATYGDVAPLIPEPGSVLLFSCGLALLGTGRRRTAGPRFTPRRPASPLR